MISKIEIDFPVSVDLPRGWKQQLDTLVRKICDNYEQQNPGRVMWPFGCGCKPTYVPLTAEEEKHRGAEYDDSIYHIEVAEREGYPKELDRRKKKKFMTGQEKIELMKKLGCPGPVVGRNEMILCEEINRLKEFMKDLNKLVHDQIVVMQSALIDGGNKTPKDGLRWIYNQLFGPGCLPDENDKWFHDANLYYQAHRSDPFGPCEVCGIPSSFAGQGHVACSQKHFEQLKSESTI